MLSPSLTKNSRAPSREGERARRFFSPTRNGGFAGVRESYPTKRSSGASPDDCGLRIADYSDGETEGRGDGEKESASSNVSQSPRPSVSPSAFHSAFRNRLQRQRRRK